MRSISGEPPTITRCRHTRAIIDWVTATGLRPWLQDLTESEQQLFLKRYHQMLEEQYPLQENGQILLAFPRLFIVARRME